MKWCQRVFGRYSGLLEGNQEILFRPCSASDRYVAEELWCFTFRELKDILEQFRNSVPRHIEMYLNSQEVTEIRSAATMVNSYELPHREVGSRKVYKDDPKLCKWNKRSNRFLCSALHSNNDIRHQSYSPVIHELSSVQLIKHQKPLGLVSLI